MPPNPIPAPYRYLSRRKTLALLAGMAALAPLPTLVASSALAQSAARPAPQWDILEWINGDGGNVDQLRGKVIVIDFFQLWCPGCNQFSGPLMTHWQKTLATEIAAGALQMVKIHTVFEGHNYQTVRKLKSYVTEKSITLPVGVDRHADRQRIPTTMRRYRTRGTPEMVMIDKKGTIRFQQFGYFDPAKGEEFLRALLAEKVV